MKCYGNKVEWMTAMLLTILLGSYPGSSICQSTARFDRIGRGEGLSQSSVNCMLRDKEGFMWFGTQDGLNRYDGKRFKVFQNQPGDTSSLSNNYIVSITEDESGHLWVGTMAGGLNCFDKKTEKFRVFQHSARRNSISENTVWTLISDRKGCIWAGTSKGLNRYSIRQNKFNVYLPVATDSTSLSTEMVVSLFNDSKGRIWVGTVEGLCLVNQGNGKFTRYYNPSEKELKGANLIWSISETTGGEIVTGTNNGVYLLNPLTGKYRRILGSPKDAPLVAWSVNAIQPGQIWAGTDRGLFRLETQGNTIISYLHDPAVPSSLPNNNVWCLLTDPAGFLWAGTNNGICKTRTTDALFHMVSAKEGSSPVLSSSKVMAVLEDRQGNLWVGTDGGGLNCISHDRKKVTVYNSKNSGLVNDNVWALAEDRSGDIFIGNYQGGLHRWDRQTGRIKAYSFNRNTAQSLGNPRVLCLLAARDGTLWIGTRGGGLNRLHPESGQFEKYQHSDEDPSGFPSNTVLSLAEDASGQIWAGTHEGGLALYIPAKNTFRTFSNSVSDPSGISDNNVWALEFDSRGRLWAGTQGGLNVCENPNEKVGFQHFTTRDGLQSNSILGIKADREGNIWMSTFSGLAKLDIRVYENQLRNKNNESGSFFKPLFILFDTDHGLQGLEFNQGCSHRGYSGKLYFGGNNGLNYFSEKDVRPSDFHPPLVFTGFRIFNREVGIDDRSATGHGAVSVQQLQRNHYSLPLTITHIQGLRLSYRESVISFEFAALDFSNPGKNLYAYRMVNFDDDWNYVGTRNTATYTNLDPGEYTLLIRGSNSDGIWNPGETLLKIIITPPFWKTAWFITIICIAILLGLFGVMRQLILNQRRKAQRDKEMIELQLKTIKSQIDPHFAFNAINTIAGFIYSEKPDVTYDYFTRFAWMIRNILEDNEKISRPLSEEMEFVKNYLELQKMRFRDKFEYSLVVGEEVPLKIQVPKMIIQSYAENAIKHGLMHRKEGGLLVISIRMTSEELIIRVEDNGVGRARAAELSPGTTHLGFKIMEQIMGLYRKLNHMSISQQIEDLKDADGNAAGTRVTLIIRPGTRTY